MARAPRCHHTPSGTPSKKSTTPVRGVFGATTRRPRCDLLLDDFRPVPQVVHRRANVGLTAWCTSASTSCTRSVASRSSTDGRIM